jgi:predicted membrane GTPase involved in stress response
LSPKNKGVQRMPSGEEEEKFEGADIDISYNKLCEIKKEISKLKGEIVGIKQVGTNIEYKAEANGVISAKTKKLYDSGTLLSTTNELEIRHPKILKGRFLGYCVYGVIALSSVISYITTSAINPK